MSVARAVLPVAVLLLVGWLAPRPRETDVEIRILGPDGKLTPAMLCISDAATGAVRLPPDGREAPRPSTTAEFTGGIAYARDRNWVGPVRKTTGKGDNRDRSYVYELLPSIPWWAEPVMYQTSGEFSIKLPEGRWRIAVSRGMETVPVVEEFATGGRAVAKTVRLERWIDLAKEGWISGDVHVHHPTTAESHREYLLEYARAEDVRIVNLLEQTHHGGRHSPQAAFGEKSRVRKGDHWLVSGQEAPSSTFGHIIGLNVDRLVHNPETYDFYDLAFRQMHEKKEALVGYAHFSWNGCDLPRGFAWNVTTGEVDFVELLQFAKLNALDYYEYLNLGFKLVAAAGSDVPWGSTMGEVRTYVHTGPTFDPDRWFAGLKAGNSFVTNGPALDFTVDGKLPGSGIEKAAGGAAKVVGRVRGHAKIGLPETLRLVGNEGVLKELKSQAKETELAFEMDVPVRESGWLALSASCANGALAHSSPVYLVVDGRPTWSPARAPALIEKQLAAIRKIEKEFAGKPDPRSRGIVERLARAVTYYEDLGAEINRRR
jgi:hypothetical protein